LCSGFRSAADFFHLLRPFFHWQNTRCFCKSNYLLIKIAKQCDFDKMRNLSSSLSIDHVPNQILSKLKTPFFCKLSKLKKIPLTQQHICTSTNNIFRLMEGHQFYSSASKSMGAVMGIYTQNLCRINVVILSVSSVIKQVTTLIHLEHIFLNFCGVNDLAIFLKFS